MKVVRGDRIEFPHGYTTKSGFINAYAIVTRTGVFKYLNADGSIRRELRHPDDVFKQDSLETLRRIPITVNHPSELVNSDNANRYQVGSTGDNFAVDGQFVMASLCVHQKSGIDAIENGKSQLSLGYEIDLLDEVGEYNGEQYDARQTNIEYNHLAIVDLARAGKEASIKMDSGDIISVSSDIIKQVSSNKDSIDKTKVNQKEAVMKIIVIDGVAIQVEDSEESKLKSVVDAMNKKVTEANALAATAQAKADSIKAELDKTIEKLKTETSDSVINARIANRVKLESNARNIVGDKADFTGKTDAEVKKMAVIAFDSKANVDGGDAYVNAYFDIAVSKSTKTDNDETGDEAGNGSEDGASNQRVQATTPKTNADHGRKFDSEDTDRDAMMKSFIGGKK